MKVKNSGTIYYRPEMYNSETSVFENRFEFWPIDGDASHLGVPVCPLTIEFEAPDHFDPRPGQIKQLEEQLTVARAEFQRRQTDIMRKINELQAIEAPAIKGADDDIPF